MQNTPSRFGAKVWLALLVGLLAILMIIYFSTRHSKQVTTNAVKTGSAQDTPNPALTVQITKPALSQLDNTIEANGSIQPWQEAIIGAEVNGLMLKEVLVNVGDVVKKGQVLAQFSTNTIDADIAQTTASLAEAKASYLEASNNAERARGIRETGALSRQQVDQYLSSEAVAKARVESAEANLNLQKIKRTQTTVLSPDAGVISARSATVGAVAGQGLELFRLVRQGRLEWRAEITSADIAQIKPNTSVKITLPDGSQTQGKVRVVSPAINQQTRNGLAYIDLPTVYSASNIKAGMFARGRFYLSASQAMTLPANAIVLREGFAYLMQVSADSRIKQIKVQLGRRNADRVEVIGLNNGDINMSDRFVAAGGAFLADGNLVRVVSDTDLPTDHVEIKHSL